MAPSGMPEDARIYHTNRWLNSVDARLEDEAEKWADIVLFQASLQTPMSIIFKTITITFLNFHVELWKKKKPPPSSAYSTSDITISSKCTNSAKSSSFPPICAEV